MTGEIVTDGGLQWTADKTLDNVTSTIDTMAIGTGTTDPSEDDTSLESKEYEATSSDSDLEIEEVDSEVGLVRGTMTITGGTQVSGGTEITEIGVFADNTLIYREVREAVTITNGVQTEFVVDIEIIR